RFEHRLDVDFEKPRRRGRITVAGRSSFPARTWENTSGAGMFSISPVSPPRLKVPGVVIGVPLLKRIVYWAAGSGVPLARESGQAPTQSDTRRLEPARPE